MPADLLDRWLAEVVAAHGLTAIRDLADARRVLLDDALLGVPLVRREDGPIVDVGSGGGTPGIPLAASLPRREVTLLEAERRKCDFLERWTTELPNLRVVWGRAEEQPLERFGVAATARASFAFYNDRSDVDRLLAGLARAVELFRG